MDFSANNTELWAPIIQMGILAALILLANILLRKIPFIKNSLMPLAVLSGFILLILRSTGIVYIDAEFLEKLTYHALALGFIAMALRVPEKKNESGALIGAKSGALIVSTYLVQGIIGLGISIILVLTAMPELFPASGILLPMAYGQGPGQANNVGTTYEALGMAGGRTFGLSLAAAGYLCACVVGVIFLNIYSKRGIIKRRSDKTDVSGSLTLDTFQHKGEIPIAESVDKLSVQFAFVAIVYLITYLVTWGISALLEAVAPGAAATVSTLLWGFNFIIGSVIALACRVLLSGLKSVKLMSRQYQNNYLLSRISGLAFDLMIIAGIAGIEISDLEGMWVPFIIMAVLGGIVTFIYLKVMCKKLYPEYVHEGFFSMYGMLTGTISSGILLLREVDAEFDTPAANNLILGSSFGIIFGAPVLLLVSLAAKGFAMSVAVLAILGIYLLLLLVFMLKAGRKKK